MVHYRGEGVEITVEWRVLTPSDPRWHHNRCLYAYAHPHSGRILYVGKAYQKTVFQRLAGLHKAELFGYLLERWPLGEGQLFAFMHGRVRAEAGRRVTAPVLRDVESLLIRRLRPPGNQQCIVTRIERPGMRVTCLGAWPYRRRTFVDALVRVF